MDLVRVEVRAVQRHLPDVHRVEIRENRVAAGPQRKQTLDRDKNLFVLWVRSKTTVYDTTSKSEPLSMSSIISRTEANQSGVASGG